MNNTRELAIIAQELEIDLHTIFLNGRRDQTPVDASLEPAQ